MRRSPPFGNNPQRPNNDGRAMSPTFDAFLRSWPPAPWLALSLLITACVFASGWRQLHRRDPDRWHAARLIAFLAGLATIYLALASPVEPFASLLLSVHMVQHLLLMMIAPPLLWLGWPLFPMVRGLPEPVRTYWIAPLLRSRRLRRLFATLTHPLFAWPLFVGLTWLWHLPPMYERGLVDERWHFVQHVCFIVAAMLFWYPVVRPYPSRPRWSKWLLFPYLLLADVQNTVLAAWLTFAPGVLYPYYLQVPRLDGISALDDQRLAGALMWVPGSVAFLLPLFWIAVSYLIGKDRDAPKRQPHRREPLRQKSAAFDLLEAPLVGRFLRWRHARRSLQLVLFALAGLVIYDGLRGPPVGPTNLAGVLPWIHWRGLLILSLLVAGNFFCMACPFTLPRSLARRWMPAGRPWPHWLRSKWLAVVLLGLFLWSYEAFALWDSPWITAWIVVGYFVAAFVVDSVFADAAFCKYVCPIGQFNFVQSLISPLEVRVRQPALCTSCTTHDCLRGNATSPGCELQLYQPQKLGNFDCTFCLDCVHACPHENVGVLAAVPGRTLWRDAVCSGIGRWSRRPDVAALVLLLVFGAFANAAGMIGPVVEWQDRLRLALGDPPRVAIVTACYLVALVVLPLLVIAVAALVSRRWGALGDSALTTATRFAFALVPIGFGMWLAHYSFHFFTSWQTIVPVAQRFAADHGWQLLGDPLWHCACCEGAAAWIPRVELLMLDVGLLASLYAGFRIAEANTATMRQAVRALVPWATVVVMLFLLGVWIVFQPMEMRGTLPLAGVN
jgi:cytochrome c oxidase assembly factor CtaG